MGQDQDWWRGAVIYQIYPRSYQDSNNDGIGDLPGIIDRLDYIASLGVDAIWISPFFQSPMKDFGYDVSDFRAVDPLFGRNEDADRLIEKTHERGMKLILDMVFSHTSDQHPWFRESRKSPDNPKADWYIWADPKEEGSPPNNWQSVFGGSAWKYDMWRKKYYLHNFLESQPDLNLLNPDVRKAIFDEARFWLDKGIDGFRLDVANMYIQDPQLRDNPPRPAGKQVPHEFLFYSPYEMQDHIYDKSRPENLPFIEELRSLAEEYDNRFLMGEIFDDDEIATMQDYIKGTNRLHTAYCFYLLTENRLSPEAIKHNLKAFYSGPGKDGWISWAMSNHDVVRPATRWAPDNIRDARVCKMMFALLNSLRGSTCIFQGEELGLTEAELNYEQLVDPWGKFLYPQWQGRDGCRTPMPWDEDKPHAGFSTADETWLPVPDTHKAMAVSAQENDPGSVLNFTRAFLQWRKQTPALIYGDIDFIDTGSDNVLAFTRTYEGQCWLCLFNFSAERLNLTLPLAVKGDEAAPSTGDAPTLAADGRDLALPGFGAFYGRKL